jgi:hypothetical protein
MRIICLLILGALSATTFDAAAHGVGHLQRSEERASLAEAVDVQATGVPMQQADPDRDWGVYLNTGWQSRHVHYGVDESGPSGAYINEAGLQHGNFTANVWNGFGLGNDLVEWDFTAAYNFEAGPVFIMPGYNFRYVPSQNEGEHGHEDEEHGHEEESDSHAHNEYGNELLLALGTHALPYITPSAVFIWDLHNLPGAFLELRLDGDLPVYGEVVSLQPYALLGLNFGYNTTEVYGPNNFQFGLQATCRLCAWAAFFVGANYSVALEALDAIDQDNVFWINVGLSFAY